MPLPRQKFREVVFQLLYSYDMGEPEDEEIINLLSKELSIAKSHIRLAHQKILKIREKIPEIDSWLSKASASYEFERIQSVERNILRLGTYELLFDESIPPKVAIAEAIRLARKFSTKASGVFVNALLDNVNKAHSGQAMDNTEIVKAFHDYQKESDKSDDRT